MKKLFSIVLGLIIVNSILVSNAFSKDTILTLRLVHPNHDRLAFLPPPEAKIDKTEYEYFAKEDEHYYISNKIELDINDMEEAKLRVVTPPSKEEIAELSKKHPNTSFSIEPTYNVTIKLNKEGQKKMADVTGTNIMRRLAIIFEGNLLVAPVIMEKITGGTVAVSGLSNYNQTTRLRNTINNQSARSN